MGFKIMGCDIWMWLEKYTNEDDGYILDLVKELDSYGNDQDDSVFGGDFQTIRQIKNRIKEERRDDKLSQILNSSIEKRWIVIDEPCDNRNYHLFSKLANVRNYKEEITPISSPRGIPDDCSIFYMVKSGQWEGDGHSHSYFYLSELLEHDFTQISKDFSDFVESYRGKDDIDNYRIVFFFDN